MSAAKRNARRNRLAEEKAFRSSIANAMRGTSFAAVTERLIDRLNRFQRGCFIVSESGRTSRARALDAWLDDLEEHLVEFDPATTWKLVDRFIRADHAIVDRAGDFGGPIGDCFDRACALWLRTAAALPADAEWVERIHALRAGSGSGTRDAILDRAGLLLSEVELRRLARIYADEVRAALRRGDLHRAAFAADALGQVDRVIGEPAALAGADRSMAPTGESG
jgi:hypothetical protein